MRAVILDSVGVLFSPYVLFDADKGEMLRERSHIDGQGISLLRAAGVKIAFVSSEKTSFLKTLADKLNGLPSVKSGTWAPIEIFEGLSGDAKTKVLEVWSENVGVPFEACAYMGDDIGDYAMMQKVGFPCAPSQAEGIVKEISKFISEREGGRGAIRDLANYILKAKGTDPLSLNSK